MRVGVKNPDSLSPVLADRTRLAIDHALFQLKESKLQPYIRHVYLYGSAARKMQTYVSDVDILVEFSENFDTECFREEILNIKGKISSPCGTLPEVDMHIAVGSEWKNRKLLYYKNIKEEGIDLWDAAGTRT